MDAHEQGQARFGRYFCRRCAEGEVVREGRERCSMTVYAGTYCDACWAADGRNHDRQFDRDDAGESLEPGDY
jgi:hypothetical protein